VIQRTEAKMSPKAQSIVGWISAAHPANLATLPDALRLSSLRATPVGAALAAKGVLFAAKPAPTVHAQTRSVEHLGHGMKS